ncbi:MAG TPA: 5-formyltetrahydrofolate cyclo-ligase [Burkholderiales bacterium]|nr:5-formyltetrahydrofolate cyclo-ligase [Burkholderiales bacterium]
MDASLKTWRKAQRERLIATREALPRAVLERRRRRIDASLERAFPGLAGKTVAFCWPIRNEYDARHIARHLRRRGSRTALPVVVAARAPLVFREWRPGIPLARGALDIPYPASGPAVVPEAVLLPMNGWDAQGFRLGYGAGFFDRTLAALSPRPVVIGVAYEDARVDTIHPQPWDIPVDYLVTERGVYRRDPGGLAFLGEPPGGDDPSALSSPVCYAGELTSGSGS